MVGNSLSRKIKFLRRSGSLICEFGRKTLFITAANGLSTGCSSATHKDLWLSGRPREPASRKNVEMKMKHRLAGALPVIDYHPVALSIESFVLSNFSRGEEQMPDEFPIRFGHAVDVGNMLFGNDERVHRRLGIDILERGNGIILVDDF